MSQFTESKAWRIAVATDIDALKALVPRLAGHTRVEIMDVIVSLVELFDEERTACWGYATKWIEDLVGPDMPQSLNAHEKQLKAEWVAALDRGQPWPPRVNA